MDVVIVVAVLKTIITWFCKVRSRKYIKFQSNHFLTVFKQYCSSKKAQHQVDLKYAIVPIFVVNDVVGYLESEKV